jgi:serine/threonine protein kinase
LSVGTFSSVYKAISLENPNEIVALKRIYPTSTPSRILNEIQLLRELGYDSSISSFMCIFPDTFFLVF